MSLPFIQKPAKLHDVFNVNMTDGANNLIHLEYNFTEMFKNFKIKDLMIMSVILVDETLPKSNIYRNFMINFISDGPSWSSRASTVGNASWPCLAAAGGAFLAVGMASVPASSDAISPANSNRWREHWS